MKPYRDRIFIFCFQRVINIMLLMPDTRIPEARWALLRDMHVNYKYEHQVSIVIASMAIHNYIRKTGRFDEAFNRAQQESYIPAHNRTSSEGDEEGPSTHRTSNDNSYMATIRDIIAQDIMEFRR
ncbi:unnamed protein product [Lactuca virosa]|uniref:Uncharacterized protein n=1 Tax=Lactuca virosa TaxID=75947 RepID=A0AAU9NEF1_9ASTR|nr:unnamed protein product [Lactuca virosa]